MQGHGDEQGEIDPQGGHTGGDDLRLAVEHPDHQLRQEHGRGPEGSGIGHRQPAAESDGLAHPAVQPRAVVKAHYRLCAVAQTVDGHEEHLPQGVDDGHHAHIQVPAIALEGGVAHDLHQTVGHVHKEAGQAKGHDALDPPGLEGEIPQFQGEQRPPPGEEFQHPGRRDGLGDDGGQGRPLHPHVQQKDEDGVQDDVHRRPQHHRHHAHRAKALGVDEGVHAEAYHHKQGAHEIDGHVVVGIGEGGVAGSEQIENGPLKGQEKGGAGRP